MNEKLNKYQLFSNFISRDDPFSTGLLSIAAWAAR
jgi:hypothetical protein